jgi:hypothetical protein
MPRSYLLQDWTTVRGAANQTLTQSFQNYLDLDGYIDAIFYLQVSYVSSSPVLNYQSAALPDDAYFYTIATRTLSASTTPFQDKVLFASAAAPMSRFIRWSITHTAAYAATFRVWCTVREG